MDVSQPLIYYHADLTREHSVVVKILAGFKWFLHCDAYAAYKNLPGIELAMLVVSSWVCQGKKGKQKWQLTTVTQSLRLNKN